MGSDGGDPETDVQLSGHEENDRIVRQALANQKKRRGFIKAIGGAASAGLTTSIAGCLGGVGGGGGDNTVKVGLLYPLSGSVGESGQLFQTMINAVTENIINQQNSDLDPLYLANGEGLSNHDGAKVELAWGDHAGKPSQGRSEAERLINEEDIDILVGAFHSAVSMTVSKVAEREEVPMFIPASADPKITRRGLKWIWRVGPNDELFVKSIAGFLSDMQKEHSDFNSVALLRDNSDIAETAIGLSKQYAKDNGFEVAQDEIVFNPDTINSFETIIQKIESADPDVILTLMYLKSAKLFMQDAKSLGYTPPMLIGHGGGFSYTPFIDSPDISDHVCARSAFSQDLTKTSPVLEKFNGFIKEESDRNLTGISIRVVGGFLTAMKILNEAGSTNPDDIAETANNIDLPRFKNGLPYPVRFDDNHQNIEGSGIIVQYKDSNSNTVWPFEIATKDVVYPAPAWDER